MIFVQTKLLIHKGIPLPPLPRTNTPNLKLAALVHHQTVFTIH